MGAVPRPGARAARAAPRMTGDTLLVLPDEVLLLVLAYLAPADLFSCSLVCSRLKYVVRVCNKAATVFVEL